MTCSPVTGPDAPVGKNNNGLLDLLVEEQTWHCADTVDADHDQHRHRHRHSDAAQPAAGTP